MMMMVVEEKIKKTVKETFQVNYVEREVSITIFYQWLVLEMPSDKFSRKNFS